MRDSEDIQGMDWSDSTGSQQKRHRAEGSAESHTQCQGIAEDISYRAMVEALDCMIYVCSSDYRILFMNERLIERAGYNATNKVCYEALHERKEVCPWCVNERVFKGETVRWEVRSPKDNRWFSVVNSPLRLPDGTVCKQAMFFDITEQKRSEEFLRKSKEILEMAATGKPLHKILMVLVQTVEALIPGCACSVVSVEEQENRLRHLCAPSLPEELVESIESISRRPETSPFSLAFARKELVIIDDIQTDRSWEICRGPVCRFGIRSLWIVPISGTSADTTGCLAVYLKGNMRPSAQDLDILETSAHLTGIVMEAKRSECALRESEEKFRTVADYTYDWEYWINPDGNFIYISPSCLRITGYEPAEFVSNPDLLFQIIHPEDRAAFGDHTRNIHCGQESVCQLDFRIIRRDGEVRWIGHLCMPVFSENGTWLGRRGSNRDITERKRIEEKIIESAQKIKSFAYSVSHDLKSPAIALNGLARLLKNRYQEFLDQTGKSCCDQIMRASEQVAELVEKVNIYISTNQNILQLETFNLKEIFRLIGEEFSGRFASRQVRWETPEIDVEITADRVAITRILRNLVDNALKYGGSQLSRIIAGYQSTNAFHILTVANDGAGIRVQDRARIFEAFRRTEAAKGIAGTGLGLAIVKEIAQQHGGQAWIESYGERGVTFFVSISKSL